MSTNQPSSTSSSPHRRPLSAAAQAMHTLPTEIQTVTEFYGDFEFVGADATREVKPEEFDTASPVFYWASSFTKVGVLRNTSYDGDGYPYAACKFIDPIDGDTAYWNYTHIAETWTDAIAAAERNAQLRTYIHDSDSVDETYSEWQENNEEGTLKHNPQRSELF